MSVAKSERKRQRTLITHASNVCNLHGYFHQRHSRTGAVGTGQQRHRWI